MVSAAWLALSIPAFARASVLGVAPHQAALYVPITSTSPATWKCLNDSRIIPFTSVNDDFCDCNDGTDEPGTSACMGSTFYCINAGHVGASIRGSRVNDGLCELECCDGSDEPAGVCPNVCKVVGDEFRKHRDASRKLRKTGAKIRSTYVAFAKKEQKRLEDSIVLLEKEVVVREAEADRLQDLLERSESISHAAMEHRKGSPLYTTLLTHSRALKSLQKYHKQLKEKEKTLSDILANLKAGYNPNYQDMAVLEAVRGWETYSGTGAEPEPEGDGIVSVGAVEAVAEEPVDQGTWTEDQLEYQLDGLLEKDYESLLVEHDEHVASQEAESQSTSFLPAGIASKYESAKDNVIGWMRNKNLIGTTSVNPSEETNRARTTFNEAETALRDARDKAESNQEDLRKLFDPEWYGREGEWKKLHNTCLSLDNGEYVYEVCLFGTASQKSKNGGSNHLGSFTSWNKVDGVEIGSPAFYSRQMYTRGARCWNGPERSVTLIMECGTENAILSVSEPEKCEYHLTGTSPALCLPLGEDEQHGEL